MLCRVSMMLFISGVQFSVMKFAVASWNVFFASFGYNLVELCSDCSVFYFCYVIRV